MKTHHYLKTWIEYFEQSAQGNKQFEIRLNDRDFKLGDPVLLVEIDKDTNAITGRTLKRQITYITSFGCNDGFVALGVSPCV